MSVAQPGTPKSVVCDPFTRVTHIAGSEPSSIHLLRRVFDTSTAQQKGGQDAGDDACHHSYGNTSLIGLNGCQRLGDSETARIKSEIEVSVKKASQAWEEFPRSLDRAGLMKYYAADYAGVKDGVSENLKDLEKSFDDLAVQFKLGSRTGISYKITELNIQPFTERIALVIYQDETLFGRDGNVQGFIKSKCSTLVRKEGESWLIFHEHCSASK
jgi:hypothetical protein